MSPHLTAADKQALRDALQARRSALDAQRRGHLQGSSRAEHAHEVLLQDGDDAPQRDADREVDLAMADRDVVALAEIDDALQRLAAGGYGLCADCGDAIAAERLRLAPTARRCVACEARRERGTARPPSL